MISIVFESLMWTLLMSMGSLSSLSVSQISPAGAAGPERGEQGARRCVLCGLGSMTDACPVAAQASSGDLSDALTHHEGVSL